MTDSKEDWYDDESNAEEAEFPLHEYELTATPNDFNVLTLFSFIASGTVKIPGFQRNYVWDIKRASKLIESMIIGLPVPQIFLYEESRNKFLVIDGQQRLMSIYYFIKQRFSRKEKRTDLRHIFDQHSHIPDKDFDNEEYFTRFNLNLPEQAPGQRNKFHGLNYLTLGDYRSSFDLRTIRCVIVKQVSPENDDSAIYEMFNRLNSGGVNLRPQEIRMSLYHSPFYKMLYRVNTNPKWRKLIGIEEPDLHMKDLEFLLRGFAMFIDGENYKSSMVKFLNNFSLRAKNYDDKRVEDLEQLFLSFLNSCSELPVAAFQSSLNRFSITLFESIFFAVCRTKESLAEGKVTSSFVSKLKKDDSFQVAAERTTTSQKNVKTRLERARALISLT